ncbi:MAG: hypothetical protein AAF653_05265 [Chloroflexota bacterium]
MTEASLNQSQPSAESKSIEERLQPWIDRGEYVIVLTIAIMMWAAGWVDVLAFESEFNPTVFNRYPIPVFAFLIVYTLGFGFWFWLVGSIRALDGFIRVVGWAQRQPLLYFGAWAGFIVVIYSMFTVEHWLQLPLLMSAVLVYMVLFTGLVLLAKPAPDSPFQRWRKVALVLVGALIVLEVSLQALAYLRVLPLNYDRGTTVPFGRVYQNTEGFADGRTNSLGWYYPEFTLSEGTDRILLSGDTFVEALQVSQEAHMGQQLQSLLNESEDVQTEVLAQGQIGYGSTMFMNSIMSPYIWEPLEPAEIVVVFHVANDFQIEDSAVDPRPKWALDENGTPIPADEDFDYWHRMAHTAIAGHDPINPARTIGSNLLVVKVGGNLLAAAGIDVQRPDFAMNIERTTDEQPFGPASYMFATDMSTEAEYSLEMATALMGDMVSYMDARGIAVRLVTIPFFPEQFYEQSSEEWQTMFGGYDVLLAEQRLQEVAADLDVSFLGMGQYLQDSGQSADDVRGLFLSDGFGHLSEAGHAAFADAMYACFYADGSTDVNGCVAE